MSEPSSITWVRFEGDSQIGDFMNAAVQLHQPILDRLSDDQRPFFHDYWLRTFNDSLTFLGMIDGEPHALISQPSHSDIHQYRWRTSSLACSGREAKGGAQRDRNRRTLAPVLAAIMITGLLKKAKAGARC